MALNKKMKIIVIASISTTVLVLGLGVGLGVGLSSTSDSSPAKSSLPVRSKQLPSGLDYEIDKEIGKLKVNGHEYDYLEEDGEEYVIVPSKEALFNEPLVSIPGMFDLSEQTFEYDENGNFKVGKGRDYFYKTDYFQLGVIKITNDGKIWAGFDPIMSDDSTPVVTGYQSKTHDKQSTPIDISEKLPYEVGSFDANGSGGLNMLKVEKYLALIDNDAATVEDQIDDETEITWGLFKNIVNDERVTLITNKLINGPNARPSTSIAINPTSSFGTIPSNGWSDGVTRPKPSDFDPDNVKTYYFEVQAYKKRDGSAITFEWKDNESTSKEFNYKLKDIYVPVKIKVGGIYDDEILGTLQASASGQVLFPDTIVSKSDGSNSIQIQDKMSSVILPELKVKLDFFTYNENLFATPAIKTSPNELLINVPERLLLFFQSIAQNSLVLSKAKELGITIRFKVNGKENESRNILALGKNDKRSAEVFFINKNNAYLYDKKELLQPLKYQLKSNLDDSNKFVDSWRIESKLTHGENIDKYGLYPAYEKTQFIAYNKNFLPNGFDFTTKDLTEYLYQGDLGDLNTVFTVPNSSSEISENAKTSLLISDQLLLDRKSLSLFALNYYNDQKVDQIVNQQDIIWKKSDTEKSYWSIFADASLKDNSRFQKWVDHIKSANSSLAKDFFDTYAIAALVNERIGGVVVDFQTAVYSTDYSRAGSRGGDGTTEEKRAILNSMIRYQPLPLGLSEVGEYVAMISSINDKKQQLAETFLNALMQPIKNASSIFSSDFPSEEFSARRDFGDKNEEGAFPNKLAILNAISNTPTSNSVGIPSFFDTIIDFTIREINNNSTYESVANAFRDALIANDEIDYLYDPSTGNVYPSS